MTRDDVRELHYITHLDNLASILNHGILSNHEVSRRGFTHVSVALSEVQERRRKQIPGGQLLHDYANLYFNARNPMMFRRVCDREVTHTRLAVLRISPDVLDIPGVVVSDGNAASRYVRFFGVEDGLGALVAELVFARDWRDANEIVYYRKKSATCSEVLVPCRVPADMLTGAYLSCPPASALAVPPHLDILIRPDIFFQQATP